MPVESVRLHLDALLLATCVVVSAGVTPAPSAGQEPDPCTLLADSLLARHFAIGEGAVTRTPGGPRIAHPFCAARWRKADADAIEARQAQEMAARMMAQMRGEEVPPVESATSTVSLTVVAPRAESPAAAKASFDAALEMIARSRTVTVGGRNVTRDGYTSEPVEGVADAAAWIPEIGELAVVSGHRRFSVTVEVSAEPSVNQALAEALARELATALG